MARFDNSIPYGSGFNLSATSPIDSRMRVEHESDLTLASTWPSDKAPLYNGLTTTVMDTGDIWVLKNVNYSGDTESGNGWKKVGNVNTWRKVTVNGTELLGTGTDTGPLSLSAGTNVSLTTNNGTIIINSSGGGGGPSADTWRQIKLNNTEILGTDTSTNPLNIITGSNISIENSNGNLTISATDTTYSASDFDIKDLTDSTNLRTTWSGKQDALTEGSGITINDVTISANSDATTTGNITVTAGAPINATDIWSNNIIPSGTTIQEILLKLLCKEQFPTAPTLPSISADGNDFGIIEYEEKVTGITQPSETYNDGHFNPTTWTQPDPGITWSNTGLTSSSCTGFVAVTGEAGAYKVSIGSNSFKYNFSGDYSAPTTTPKSNLGNDYTASTATWVASSTTKTAEFTATGCYPCFCNINGNTFTSDITSGSTKYVPTNSTNLNKIYYTNVPAETTSLVFKFAYPNNRTIKFYGPDTTEAGYALINDSKYETNDSPNFYKGKTYTILTSKLQATGGISRCYFELGKNLNVD